jgi:hypothetical protein
VPLHNADIAAIFEEIADLLEIKGDNSCSGVCGKLLEQHLKSHTAHQDRSPLTIQGSRDR